MFQDSPKANITTDGERHLGAVIGSDQYRVKYVEAKVSEWIEEIAGLTQVAKEEPHLAYSAYSFVVRSKWNYVMRVIPNISPILQPLENEIRKLIAVLVGRDVNDLERR